MISAIAEAHFFPCIEYFYYLHKADVFVLEAHESFQKQSYRSRCEILGPNGRQTLTIPVSHGSTRSNICNSVINYQENWVPVFWKSLEAAYKRSPYFDYFELLFKPLLFEKQEHLFDLNMSIILNSTQFLGITTKITTSVEFEKNPTHNLDLRNKIHPKRKNIFQCPSYPQNFGNKFEQNLSILDLIMNEGPSGLLVLDQINIP